MKTSIPTSIQTENAELRQKLQEAEEILHAIQNGAVDALIAIGPEGEQVYALKGAERPYRMLVEEMNVGAITLSPEGTIIYSNPRFAEMVGLPTKEVVGKPLLAFVHSDDQAKLAELCKWRQEGQAEAEINLVSDGPHPVPVQLSTRAWADDDVRVVSMIMTDITHSRRAEAQLAYQAHLLENVHDAIFATDERHVVTFWNQAAERMYNWTAGEAVGRIVYELLDMPLTDQHREEFRRLIAEAGRVQNEVVQHRRDGTRLDVEQITIPLKDKTGRITGYVSVNRDITDWKHAVDALRASERRFHLAVDNFPGIFVIYDGQRRIQFMNMPGIIMTGRSEDEIIGHTDEELYPAQVTAAYLPSLINAAETGTVQSVEARLALPGGSFASKITYVPLLDDLGKPHQILGIAEDLSERKQAEQALAEQAELLNLTHDGVLMRDLAGTIRFWNRGAEEMYGWTREEAIGKSTADLLQTQFPQPFEEIMAQLIHTGRWEGELVHTRRDSSRMVVASRWALQRDSEGHPVAILQIGNDITKRKRTEEALRMSEERFRQLNTELEARVAARTAEWEAANQALLNEIQEHARAEDALRASEERFRLFAENAQDLIYRIRLFPERRYEYVSPSATRILGYTPEEFYADPDIAHKLVQPEDREMLAAIQRGEIGSDATVVLRWTRKDGTPVWLEQRHVPVYDDQNELIAIEAISRDVTERKRAEEALHLANQNLMSWASQLEQRNREISYLNEMGDLLQSCITVEETFRVVENSARNLFPGDSGALYLLDSSKNLAETVATWGEQAGESVEHVFVPDHCWALRRGRIHIVEDSCTGLVCQHVNREPTESAPCIGYVCVPMVAQGETLGVLYLQTTTADLTESKRRLAVSVAEHVALAISSLKLRETLHSQAIRDPLTGLFNRRYMEESLERELRRAARKHTPIAVVMLDLDHFKGFNDNHGHEAGDAILRTFGEFLGEHVREGDIACRYGGEEFTLILPEATLEETNARMNELRTAFKQVSAMTNGKSFSHLSVSLGIAIYPDHGVTAETLLRGADAALYRAKSQGRDRVVIANPE